MKIWHQLLVQFAGMYGMGKKVDNKEDSKAYKTLLVCAMEISPMAPGV